MTGTQSSFYQFGCTVLHCTILPLTADSGGLCTVWIESTVTSTLPLLSVGASENRGGNCTGRSRLRRGFRGVFCSANSGPTTTERVCQMAQQADTEYFPRGLPPPLPPGVSNGVDWSKPRGKYSVSACCAIWRTLSVVVGPLFAEQNTPLQPLRNRLVPVHLPPMFSLAPADSRGQRQGGGHSGLYPGSTFLHSYIPTFLHSIIHRPSSIIHHQSFD